MPSLFDSHDEFSEWFSKDIESHAQSNTQLNEQQLRRLHMILKPFMLRRVKKHVQSELGEKIELDKLPDGRVMLKASRPTGAIDGFLGLLAGKTKKIATLEEINDAAASGWTGRK